MKINNNSELYTNCVFLGGTCADSTWRTDLIKFFKDSVPYFDPQVPEWTPEDAAREDACKVEHVLSEESFSAICRFVHKTL